MSVNIYAPYPGTELFDLAVSEGLTPPARMEDWFSFSYRHLGARGPGYRARSGPSRCSTSVRSSRASAGYVTPFKRTHRLATARGPRVHPVARIGCSTSFITHPWKSRRHGSWAVRQCRLSPADTSLRWRTRRIDAGAAPAAQATAVGSGAARRRRSGTEPPRTSCGGGAATRFTCRGSNASRSTFAGSESSRPTCSTRRSATGSRRGSRSAGNDVVACDPACSTAIGAARGSTTSTAAVADVRRLPFASGTFDAVFSDSTLDHFDSRPASAVTARAAGSCVQAERCC